jgi:hypothetical protein
MDHDQTPGAVACSIVIVTDRQHPHASALSSLEMMADVVSYC